MEYLPSYTDDLYLMHYGIKGMKWGVRRYETIGGQLTDAGKARYAKFKQDRYDKKQAKKAKREAFKEKMTSDEAKANYKKIAKGAAIAGGIIAAGAISYTLATKSMDAHQYNLAKKMADQFIAENPHLNLTDKERSALRDNIAVGNYKTMKDAKNKQKIANKVRMQDALNSIKDPSTRDTYKKNVSEDRYKVNAKYDDSDRVLNMTNARSVKDEARRMADPKGYSAHNKRKEANRRQKISDAETVRIKEGIQRMYAWHDKMNRNYAERDIGIYGKNSSHYKNYEKLYGKKPDVEKFRKEYLEQWIANQNGRGARNADTYDEYVRKYGEPDVTKIKAKVAKRNKEAERLSEDDYKDYKKRQGL